MNIVIPMAGRGSRFVDRGYHVPKPLIDVRGLPMYAWAVASLPLALATKLIFVVLDEHLKGSPLAADIHARYAHRLPVEIIGLAQVTRGQAETVLAAKHVIDNHTPLLIFNADTYVESDLERCLRELTPDVAGVFGVFRAPGDHWSFARCNAAGWIDLTAEKRRISDLASTGIYHFSRGADFVAAAEAAIAVGDTSLTEYYVAPLYNRLIADGLRCIVHEAQRVWPMGTPDELSQFLATYRERPPHE